MKGTTVMLLVKRMLRLLDRGKTGSAGGLMGKEVDPPDSFFYAPESIRRSCYLLFTEGLF